MKNLNWHRIHRRINQSNFSVILGLICAFLLVLPTPVSWAGKGEHAQTPRVDLAKLTIEELMAIEVTSVSKKPERLSEAAAAVYVITQEDIRRSGVTSIPEALRMVPGLQVARMDANKWAITSRGFNGRFARHMLVLIDGRSVYTPLFSGVFWEVQDTLLEDIDRIEVIRGPGGTMWGANAVNGVINIITKNARDTKGGLVVSGIGTEERGFGGVRYGGNTGEKLCYRVYAKGFERDTGVLGDGTDGHDDWRMGRTGFRADWSMGGKDSLTFQGDYYTGTTGQRVTIPILEFPYSKTFDEDVEMSGENLLFRWARTLNQESDLTLQVYYDRTEHKEKESVIEDIRDTFDIDFQHRFPLTSRHEIMWGLEYRFTTDDIKSSPSMSVSDDSRDDQLFSAFMQDEITLVPNRLFLTLGAKFERNDYTGVEMQPNARIVYAPAPRHTVWGAVSRAVRTPSRLEHTIRLNHQALPPGFLFPGAPAIFTVIIGDDNYDSEDVLAYEFGYRIQPTDRLSLDFASFYNVYDDLQTVETGMPIFPESIIPITPRNKMDGESYGVELTARWKVLDWWCLHASYAYMKLQLHTDADSTDTVTEVTFEDDIPNHQVSICSLMDLPGNLELDWWIRYVDKVVDLDVDSYITLDVHLGWNPKESLELSIVGQNLLDNHRLEYGPSTLLNTQVTEVERSVYGKLTWRF